MESVLNWLTSTEGLLAVGAALLVLQRVFPGFGPVGVILSAIVERLKATVSPSPQPLADPDSPSHPLLDAALNELRKVLLSRILTANGQPAKSDAITEAVTLLQTIAKPSNAADKPPDAPATSAVPT